MRQRVFVAIGVSDELKREIVSWQKKWDHLPVRWIKPENLHVTLIPPWYATEVDEVINTLESVNYDRKRFWTSPSTMSSGSNGQNDAVKPFTITFREITFGPNSKKPRLIWVSADTPLEIISLKSELGKILHQKNEKREFLTHLTIARFKEKDFSKLTLKNLHEKVFWQEKINSFLLMESYLKRNGAEYEKLAEILL